MSEPPALRLWVTIACSGVLAFVLYALFTSDDASSGFEEPGRLFERITAADMDMLEASPTLPRGWLPLTQAAGLSRKAVVARAIDDARKLLAGESAATPETRALLALLLIEAGREAEGRDVLNALDLSALSMRSDWARERLTGAGRAMSVERGRRALGRYAPFEWGILLLIAAGVVAGLLWKLRRPNPRLSDGMTRAPWTLGRGYAVFVRCVALGMAVVLLAVGLKPWLDFILTTYAVGGALLLALARWHLVRPFGRSLREGLGLTLSDGRWLTLLWVTLMLLALDQVLGLVPGIVAARWGHAAPWTERADEALLLGTSAAAWMASMGAVLAAPAVEEIFFRGLLFPTLSRKMGTVWAALLSAGIFGAAHLYSLPNFLAITAGGFLYALAYARTGSLLPAILAHAAHNLLVIGGMVALYR